MDILVVEDSSVERKLLSVLLEKSNHRILTSTNGVDALKKLKQNQDIRIVITDWNMPTMNGLDLCKRIRKKFRSRYIYIVMLTGKNSKGDLVLAMNAGADDYIIKPYASEELDVRVIAGERLVKLQMDLETYSQSLELISDRLIAMQETIDKDLKCAAKLQLSLLPKMHEANKAILGVNFSSMFLPCSSVAGDIYNYFSLDEHHVAFYLLDVAGHGIPSAMMSVSLSGALSPHSSHLKVKDTDTPSGYQLNPPEKVASELNKRFEFDQNTMLYFTMVYGLFDVRTGHVTLTQAGHPHPLLIEKQNHVRSLGNGGFPIGMLPDLEYESFQVSLNCGDRLILYSDGITECKNTDGEMFSEQRLKSFFQRSNDCSLSLLIEKLSQELKYWREDDEYEDDISLLALERL